MASTVLNSNPCPTEDLAMTSLAGMIAGYEQGGHKVTVREMKAEETPGGWIAVVSIDIEELEEEEELEEREESEFKKAEEEIEDQNALFFTMHHVNGQSEAERAFPDVGEEVNPVELMEENEERMRILNEANAEQPPETIGIDTRTDELSDVFENDFQVAVEQEPGPEIFMTEEELRRRKRAAELTPEPQE